MAQLQPHLLLPFDGVVFGTHLMGASRGWQLLVDERQKNGNAQLHWLDLVTGNFVANAYQLPAEPFLVAAVTSHGFVLQTFADKQTPQPHQVVCYTHNQAPAIVSYTGAFLSLETNEVKLEQPDGKISAVPLPFGSEEKSGPQPAHLYGHGHPALPDFAEWLGIPLPTLHSIEYLEKTDVAILCATTQTPAEAGQTYCSDLLIYSQGQKLVDHRLASQRPAPGGDQLLMADDYVVSVQFPDTVVVYRLPLL